MMAIAKVVSEFFMLVLAMLAAPADLKEFRVDMLQSSGRIETVVVRRTETGFALFEARGADLKEMGTVSPVAGSPSAFTLKLQGGPEQTIDFAKDLPGFDLAQLRSKPQQDLKASDNTGIRVHRSGGAVYLTPERGRITYVTHKD